MLKNPEKFKKLAKNNYVKYKEYRRVKAKEYYQQNRQKIKERQKKYNASEAGKMSRKRGKVKFLYKITYQQWLMLCEAVGKVCQICFEPHKISELEIDHIIPRSKGGESKLENYQPLCRLCNTKKASKV
jgi:5-methylcytosine-specific restriction endonuclease McrA